MAGREVPEGACCLRAERAAAKFDRKKSWLWARLKDDKEFPKPIYLGKGAPVWIEAELDAYIAKRAAA